jgi:glycosyltransferase involved in cell wall biosynthesis
MTRIGIVPRVHGVGGMVSFREKLTAGLQKRGVEVSDDPSVEDCKALLVISGTRDLGQLRRARKRGMRVVQRLDGINWLHRVHRSPPRLYFRSEMSNLLLAFIRRFYADRVIYQSEFIRGWWEGWYGQVRAPKRVILNAVDLERYSPVGAGHRPTDIIRIMVVEGSLTQGHEVGLSWAVELAETLRARQPLPVELVVAAEVAESQKEYWKTRSRVPVNFLGVVPVERIPELDRSAHIYFSAEINPPCPNSVIEALACGLPVAGFEMGSLSELVTSEAGMVIPYGGNPWKLDHPDVSGLAVAAVHMLEELPRYQAGARARAESAFGLDAMVDKYLDVLLG